MVSNMTFIENIFLSYGVPIYIRSQIAKKLNTLCLKHENKLTF